MMILSSLETIEDGTHILVERVAELEAERDAAIHMVKVGADAYVKLEAENERLRQDIGWRDRHIDAMEAKLERT